MVKVTVWLRHSPTPSFPNHFLQKIYNDISAFKRFFMASLFPKWFVIVACGSAHVGFDWLCVVVYEWSRLDWVRILKCRLNEFKIHKYKDVQQLQDVPWPNMLLVYKNTIYSNPCYLLVLSLTIFTNYIEALHWLNFILKITEILILQFPLLSHDAVLKNWGHKTKASSQDTKPQYYVPTSLAAWNQYYRIREYLYFMFPLNWPKTGIGSATWKGKRLERWPS